MADLQHDNRREHNRYKYVKPMQLTVAKRTLKGFMADIGQGGASFIVDTMVAPGNVKVELPEADLVLEGRILSHQPAAHPGLYRHHMQFKSILLTADLENLLG